MNLRLKYIRESEALSQKEVAAFLGLERSTYNEYEREASFIPIKHLNKFCNFFNVSIDYVFKNTEKTQYDNSSKEIDISISSKRLSILQKELNLKQKDLANLLNIDQSTLSKYYHGINVVSTEILYKLSKQFHKSADYLLGKINYPSDYNY